MWSKQARKSEKWPAKYWADHTVGNEFLKGMDVTQRVNTKLITHRGKSDF